MLRYFIVLILILVTNFSFSQQRTITLSQTQNNAIKGIDRKAWAGLGNVSGHSDGYANDFTLPAKINPCEKITNVKVDVVFTGYSNTSACPHTQTFFNIFYDCTPYTGGATCPIANVISQAPSPVNTNPLTRNFSTPGFFDFGKNLSVDIIPVSNPGCNPVSSGGLTHAYTTTVTVTITDIPLILDVIDPAPVCSGTSVDITLLGIIKPGSTTGTALSYCADAAATILLPNPTAITTSGTYYIKSTLGSCSTIKPVVVTIAPPITLPIVSTPTNFCISKPVIPLTATPSSGLTLNWYGTDAVGGTPSTTAPTPTIAGTYYVSQKDAVCESNRALIVVDFVPDNGGIITPFFCNSSSSSIKFDWAPLATATKNHNFNYTYTISGGATVSGTKPNSSTEVNVTGLLPGQSVTLTINSITEYPCVLSDFRTCKVPCPLPLLKPDFAPITKKYCLGDINMPILLDESPNKIKGTWFPAVISNAKSDTYRFTPDPISFPCAETQDLFVTVVPVFTPTFNALPSFVCENAIIPVLPTKSTNTTAITGSWSPFPVNTTVVGNDGYTFIPDSGQCVSSILININIEVRSSQAPNFAAISSICLGTMIIPTLLDTAPNGIMGKWNPDKIDNTKNDTYTFTPTSTCSSPQPLVVTVIPNVSPTFAVSDTQCQGTSIITLPNFSTNTPQITGTWDNNTIDTSIVGINPRVFTATIGSCVLSTTTPKTITVYSNLMPTFSSIPNFCAGTPAPSFPISNEGITGLWSPTSISNTAGSINYQFTPDKTLFPCAPIPPLLPVTVLPSPEPSFSPLVPKDVCEGSTFVLPTNSNDTPPITGSWKTPAGPVTSIDTSIAGTDIYTFILDAGQCAKAPDPIPIKVNPSNTLINVDTIVTDAFQDNQIITVLATAAGNYLYQLDSGPLQNSPIFENVSAGTHTITVSDANGCSASKTRTDILVIKHPKYFTPNGDGFNDTWKLSSLSSILITKIYIFDRYGKLLKEIAANGTGWDGTYLGVPLPADDYWFTVDYLESFTPKKFKSHFSLKR